MKHFLYKFFVLLVLLSSIGVQVFAQLDVSGSVKDASGDPLIGVTVSVKGTNNGTVTNEDGLYSLRISGSSATLIYSYVGYRAVEREVSATANNVDIVLEETSSVLDEVIVSGLATTVKRSNAANSVAAISSKELTGITTQSTMDGALYGKFTGAQITQSSGAPGGGIGIRLRGVTSINAPNQPLFIIDGIYVDNSTIPAGLNVVSQAAAGGSTAQFDQDNPSNRIADIDPGDIESIEILKGASAAAIYGARASGGVVIITTKRGRQAAGKGPNVQFSQSLGFQEVSNLLGTRDWTEEKVAGSFGESEVQNYTDAQASGAYYDYEKELYGNKGILSDSRLSFSGNNDRTAFYSSFSHKREEGIVQHTGYTKSGLRFNLDHKVTDRIDISLSNNFLKSSADRGYFNNDNTVTSMGIALAFSPAWAELHPDTGGNYPNNPFGPSNVLQTRDLITNNEAVTRYIGGGRAEARLITTDQNSLRLIFFGGLDAYTLRTTAIFPRELQFEKDGNGTNGASIQGTTTFFGDNESLFLVHTYFPSSGKFSLRSQGGLTRQSFKRNSIITTATQLIGAQTNVSQAGSVSAYQLRTNQLDLGGFIQEELNLQDRVILTLGVRGDKSSNNGDENKLYFYPKASLAVNLAEFPFWTSQSWEMLKLRVAYGQSGNFAPYGSTFTSLIGTNIEGIAGSLINNQQGNADIKPERQTEIEAGVDLGLWNGRLNVEATYYIKNVTDLILVAQVPASSGFTTQIINGAELQNRGIEIGLGVDIVKNQDFNWFNQTNFWMNESEVTQLDIPPFVAGAFGATLGTYYIEEGQSATQIVGTDPANETTPGELFVLGNSEPDFQLSFFESFTYRNWELSFVLHWKQGGDNINLTPLLSDFGQTSFDYDDTGVDPSGTLVNGDYRIQSFFDGNAVPWIQDASYVKLREIGLYYTFADAVAKATDGAIQRVRVGLSAYNLFSIFDYSSYDPEVSNFGTVGISTGVDVNPFPSSRRYYASVLVDF